MRARKILLIDDSEKFRTLVRNSLGKACLLVEAASEEEFRREFRPYTFDLVILDMRLKSGREGLRVLREILTYDELQPVIMVSAYGDTDAVLDAAEAGALMFLHKQEFTPELLARMVEAVLQQAQTRRQLTALQNRLPTGDSIGLSGLSRAIRRAAQLAGRAAEDSDCTVLVTGEAGAGHELIAHAIHGRNAKRSVGPFVTLWMASLGSTAKLQRDQIFGVQSQDGVPRQKGLLEQANGGVLFLGGVEGMSSELLSQVVASVRQRQLSGTDGVFSIPLDVQLVVGAPPQRARAIAETLVDTSAGERLIEIYLPPLRERPEDISVLAGVFLQECRQTGRATASTVSHSALAMLEAHLWPGNLTELRNTVEYAAIRAFTEGLPEVEIKHLPAELRKAGHARSAGGWDYHHHVARAEIELAEAAIGEYRDLNKAQLAKFLGYSDRFAFGRRLRKLLDEHEGLSAEYPRVAALFGGAEKNPAAAK